jgi:CRP-like cAMP-binding protein
MSCIARYTIQYIGIRMNDRSLVITKASVHLVQPVFREGDNCDRLFIIDHGTVVSRGQLLMHGSLIGVELFLVDDTTWTHTATTLTYSMLLSLNRDTFDE